MQDILKKYHHEAILEAIYLLQTNVKSSSFRPCLYNLYSRIKKKHSNLYDSNVIGPQIIEFDGYTDIPGIIESLFWSSQTNGKVISPVEHHEIVSLITSSSKHIEKLDERSQLMINFLAKKKNLGKKVLYKNYFENIAQNDAEKISLLRSALNRKNFILLENLIEAIFLEDMDYKKNESLAIEILSYTSRFNRFEWDANNLDDNVRFYSIVALVGDFFPN